MPIIRRPTPSHPIAACLDALARTPLPQALWIESYDPRLGSAGLVASYDDWRGGDLSGGVAEALHAALGAWADWFERATGTTDVAVGRFSLARRIASRGVADDSLSMQLRSALARRLPAAEWRSAAFSYAFSFTDLSSATPRASVSVLRPEPDPIHPRLIEAGEDAAAPWSRAMGRLFPGVGALRFDLDLPRPTGHALMAIARAVQRAA